MEREDKRVAQLWGGRFHQRDRQARLSILMRLYHLIRNSINRIWKAALHM